MQKMYRPIHHQKGLALFESIIGMLILSIATLGSLLALAHSSQTQHVNGVRSQVIESLRGRFLKEGVALCGTSLDLLVNGQVLRAAVSCTELSSVAVSVPGASSVTVKVPSTDAQIITAQVNAPLLGGTLTVTSNR